MIDGFEWDENKRLSNIAERGVDFREATLIFDGPVIEAQDKRADYGELRFRALGRVGGDHYVVTYTWRGSCRRIISAWKVGDHGKARYQTTLDG
jgi:uncharacterized DUF497 family protein